jgi:1,3-beta-galactosyl-N-acetylhexosamine phosphorylase
MMFWGDNWIGAEPYGKYFPQMQLDAVVGSASSGATVRAVSDLTSVRYKEIRLNPYFFPDTLAEEDRATRAMVYNWGIERRAILRKPVDRIGFGGYLQIADKFPKFCAAVAGICDEFREIYDVASKFEPYNVLKIAVLSYWGKEKSWMTNMVSQDAPFPRTASLLGYLECISGLPVDISFISFEEAKAGKLKEFDVVINSGNAGTSFSGDTCWTDETLVTAVRQYIAEGGGFIGIGEPSAILRGGRFFQLADALGVDKDMSFSMMFNRYNNFIVNGHFITEDVTCEIDYAGGDDYVFALDGTKILDCVPAQAGNCHVKLAANEYFGGRTVYLAGLKYNAENTRLFYRALLWCAKKEERLLKAFSTNVNVECNYYPKCRRYALVNNAETEQKTVFYDIDGKAKELSLKGNEILWIDG